MSDWIITRKVRGRTMYRDVTGALDEFAEYAKVYPSASAALAAAQEGDVIEQVSSLNTSA